VSLATCQQCAANRAGEGHSDYHDKISTQASEGLSIALNELGLPHYALVHVLEGDTKRLGAYLSFFAEGFLASMSLEERAVREAAGVHTAPVGWQEKLHRQLQDLKTIRLGTPAPGEDAMDAALCEGFLVAALHEAQHTGWRPVLRRHLTLQTLVPDTKLYEHRVESELVTFYSEYEEASQRSNASTFAFSHSYVFVSSLLRLTAFPPLQRLLAEGALQPQEMQMVLLGSGRGATAFIVALLYGISVDGYEILPHRHEEAKICSGRHGVDGVRFFNGDAAAVEFIPPQWLYLGDYAWKDQGMEAHKHVSQQVPAGALASSFQYLSSLELGFRAHGNVQGAVLSERTVEVQDIYVAEFDPKIRPTN